MQNVPLQSYCLLNQFFGIPFYLRNKMVSCEFIISSVSLLATKLITGVPRLKKKDSKQFVNNMPKHLTVKKLFTRIITLTRTGRQRSTPGDVMSALCPAVWWPTLGKLCVHRLAGFILPVVKLLHYVLVRKWSTVLQISILHYQRPVSHPGNFSAQN